MTLVDLAAMAEAHVEGFKRPTRIEKLAGDRYQVFVDDARLLHFAAVKAATDLEIKRAVYDAPGGRAALIALLKAHNVEVSNDAE